MTRKERQATHFAGPVTMSGDDAGGTPAPGTGVAIASDRIRPVRHVRLELSGFILSIAADDDFGGTKLCDLPDSNITLLAVELDLELVKGGVVNGLVAATDVTVAVGTAVASNSTLSGAMVDVLTGIALTAADLSPALQIHSHADGTLDYPIELADAATLALFLNAAAAITADDALTISGTVDLYYLDVGNVTS